MFKRIIRVCAFSLTRFRSHAFPHAAAGMAVLGFVLYFVEGNARASFEGTLETLRTCQLASKLLPVAALVCAPFMRRISGGEDDRYSTVAILAYLLIAGETL